MNKQTKYSLDDLRKSLDNIDNALIYLLAERFRVTEKVGLLKRDLGLSSVDRSREEKIMQRVTALAKSVGLDAWFAKKVMRLIIDEVVKSHKKIKEDK